MINYQPRLRVTPVAGLQVSYDLTTITHLTRGQVFYDRVSIDRTFIDRSPGETPLGYVVRAELEFVIPAPPTQDQVTLAQILGYLSDPDAVVELSMGNDEFGAPRYRKVGHFSESAENEQGVLAVERRQWTLRMAGPPIQAPVPPGAGAVAVW